MGSLGYRLFLYVLTKAVSDVSQDFLLGTYNVYRGECVNV